MPTDDDAAALRWLEVNENKNWTCKFPKCHRRHDEFFMTTLVSASLFISTKSCSNLASFILCRRQFDTLSPTSRT